MTEPSENEVADEELVARIQRGDSALFNQLILRYQRRIFGVVMGMVHHREDAMDLSQEIFIKAYRSIHSFGGLSSFYTWLYRIAVNTVIDFRRRNKRGNPISLDDHVGRQIQGKHDPPDRQAIGKELGRILHTALGTLTEEQKTVILLREMEGLSYQEIADIAGCSIGTVMSRLHYARKRLKELLKPHL